MNVRDVTGAAARWLVQHDRSGRTEADDAKLLAYVVAQTGLSETAVFDLLVDHWAEIRASAASTAKHEAARGGVAARLMAAGHESPPVPGVTVVPLDDTSWLDDRILFRTATTDRKGRVYGTANNPNVPPIDQFRPRFWDVRAGDLESLIQQRMHGQNPDQAELVAKLDDRTLLSFNEDDPISARWTDGGLALTGGHHRTWEIIDRVRAGKLPPDAVLRILVHE